jgi:ferric-dicitrate binding protein FerR (iron transport regulator)
MKTVHQKKNSRRIYLLIAASAACVLALVGIFLFQHSVEEPPVLIAQNELKIENIARPDTMGDDIQIIFSEENKITLKEKRAEIKYNDKGEAEVNSNVVTQAIDTTEQQETYNQIIVPKGKHTSLTLSDGTKLWLNAFSRIVYPPVFHKEKREIYIEGEVYLEVTPDKERPFIVKTNQMEVRVLGTSFNVSAYEDETSQAVVLVSGSVFVKTKAHADKETELVPDQLFKLTGTETQLLTVKAANYISWKDGIYIHKDENLALILNRLAHYYGITVQFSPEVGAMKFSGKLDLKDNPERVLSGLSNTAPLQCRKQDDVTFLLTLKN